MKKTLGQETFRNTLRYQINKFIFDNGFAPGVSKLAELFDTRTEVIEDGLFSLHNSHALVLHPNSTDIWIAHPFALFPTLFWVKSGHKKWWGNCAWCSLGIASLVKDDCDIHTKLGGYDESATIHIQNQELLDVDYVVHFPKPVRQAWDNVIHFCASTLIFRNEDQVNQWCEQHNVEKGRVISISRAWELSKRWYGYYLEPDWQPKTIEFANQIFDAVGLEEDFWKMTANE